MAVKYSIKTIYMDETIMEVIYFMLTEGLSVMEVQNKLPEVLQIGMLKNCTNSYSLAKIIKLLERNKK